MNCGEFERQIHEFHDNQLSPVEAAAMNRHMAECGRCEAEYREIEMIRECLAGRAHLTEASTGVLLLRIHEEERGFTLRLVEHWQALRTRLRDFDRRVFWSRVTAMPPALALFLMMLSLFAPFFPPAQQGSMGFLLVSSNNNDFALPHVTSAESRQSPAEFKEWMNTARRLPYEDSLSLVVAVEPGGAVRIDGVLEYPKSDDLLSAVDAALTRSQFEQTGRNTNSLLIFSYQKIDVYSQLGL